VRQRNYFQQRCGEGHLVNAVWEVEALEGAAGGEHAHRTEKADSHTERFIVRNAGALYRVVLANLWEYRARF